MAAGKPVSVDYVAALPTKEPEIAGRQTALATENLQGPGRIRAGRLPLSGSQTNNGHAPAHQIKSRERVRDLAEVYTHKREVDAMLDLVPDMFPNAEDPGNTDRTFLEPACGSGNFLEEILRRKLAWVTVRRYGRGERYEHRILRCLASIYGIDICEENVKETSDRLRAVINSHLDHDLNTQAVSPAFVDAAEAILSTNILCADTLADKVELVAYTAGRSGTFRREWSLLGESNEDNLFSMLEPKSDARPIHYSDLAAHPDPVDQAVTRAPR